VTGNSYGGYLSAWLASTTARFGAAVIENPVADLIGMCAISDIGRRFFPAQFGGPGPWERPGVYAEQSPLLEAHRCRTPCRGFSLRALVMCTRAESRLGVARSTARTPT
jgi:dipeptidyl aminopeptidase/acylaminoacyl peptidase